MPIYVHYTPGAAPMHQLLQPGVRLQPAALHTVPGRLHPLQDQNTPRQTEVLQVYLAIVLTRYISIISNSCYYCHVNIHAGVRRKRLMIFSESQ
jgi:hypothetical protein